MGGAFPTLSQWLARAFIGSSRKRGAARPRQRGRRSHHRRMGEVGRPDKHPDFKQPIVWKPFNDAVCEWALSMGETGSLRFDWSKGGGTAGGNRMSEQTIPQGEWHHVAAVWKNNDKGGLEYYIDGAPVAPTVSSPAAVRSTPPTGRSWWERTLAATCHSMARCAVCVSTTARWRRMRSRPWPNPEEHADVVPPPSRQSPCGLYPG